MKNHLNVQKLILNINVSVAIVVQSLYGFHYTAAHKGAALLATKNNYHYSATCKMMINCSQQIFLISFFRDTDFRRYTQIKNELNLFSSCLVFSLLSQLPILTMNLICDNQRLSASNFNEPKLLQ